MSEYDLWLHTGLPSEYDLQLHESGPLDTGGEGPIIISRAGVGLSAAAASGTAALVVIADGYGSAFASSSGNATVERVITESATAFASATGDASVLIHVSGKATSHSSASGSPIVEVGEPEPEPYPVEPVEVTSILRGVVPHVDRFPGEFLTVITLIDHFEAQYLVVSKVRAEASFAVFIPREERVEGMYLASFELITGRQEDEDLMLVLM